MQLTNGNFKNLILGLLKKPDLDEYMQFSGGERIESYVNPCKLCSIWYFPLRLSEVYTAYTNAQRPTETPKMGSFPDKPPILGLFQFLKSRNITTYLPNNRQFASCIRIYA